MHISSLKKIWHLLLVVFLDIFSFAMLSPIIILLFSHGPYCIIDEYENYAYLLLGLFLASYPFFQVFGVPVWGQISCVLGKRRVLLISLLGAVLGWVLCFFGVLHKEVSLLFLGACVSGLTGAHMSTINALISQETERKNWESNFSLVGATIGIAFILGPQITRMMMAILPTNQLTSSVFALCIGLSFLNLFVVYFFLKESKSKVHFAGNSYEFIALARFRNIDSRLRHILLYLFCIYFGWFFFIKFFQVYLLKAMHLPSEYCCYGSSYLGLCCSTFQTMRFYFNPTFLKQMSILKICTLCLAGCLFSFLFIESFWQMIIITMILSLAYSAIIPTMVAMIFQDSRAHDAYRASLNQSVQSLAKIISPVLSGFLLSFSFTWPVLVSFAAVILAFFVPLASKNELKYSELSQKRVFQITTLKKIALETNE